MEGLEVEALTDAKLRRRVKNVYVFARLSPTDKLRIVSAFQANGEVVAMTGDGVNDAPALKSADIGVAIIGSGTEVAKMTADLVLVNDDFATIVAAVNEGRIMFENIRKVALYLLSDSFTEVLLVISALFAGWPLPITAAQILWINLVSDGMPDMALTFDPGEPGIMHEKPIKKREPLLTKEITFLVVAVGVITAITNLAVFYYFFFVRGLPIEEVRTVIFMTLGLDSIVYVYSVRTLRHSLFKVNPFANMWLNGAVVLAIGLQFAAIYIEPLRIILGTVPITITDWEFVLGQIVVVIVFIEITKWFFRGWRTRKRGHVHRLRAAFVDSNR